MEQVVKAKGENNSAASAKEVRQIQSGASISAANAKEVWNLAKALHLWKQQCSCFECNRFFDYFLIPRTNSLKNAGSKAFCSTSVNALDGWDPSSSWISPVLVTWQARSGKQLWKLAKTPCLWKQQCYCLEFNRFFDCCFWFHAQIL